MMKTIRVSDLIGPALDWAVAKCENHDFYGTTDPDRYDPKEGFTHNFNPSVDWSQGGPIIERETINVFNWHFKSNSWRAKYPADDNICGFENTGPTPLIAAMRCYVASKMGDGIEIPKELT